MSEITFTWARSSGPGGQHVNKTETQAVLRFPLVASPSIPEPHKSRAVGRLKNRLTTEGVLILICSRHRSRERNRRECLTRLAALLTASFEVPKPRKRTRPSKSAILRRLEAKRRRGDVKKGRSQKWD